MHFGTYMYAGSYCSNELDSKGFCHLLVFHNAKLNRKMGSFELETDPSKSTRIFCNIESILLNNFGHQFFLLIF
jgi:hypothetical protein